MTQPEMFKNPKTEMKTEMKSEMKSEREHI